MPFTIHDMSDLTRLLGQHPEWRAELRRIVLSDELLGLPDSMRQLADRMDQLADRMDQLADRLDQLAERMDQLAERMDQLARRVDQLTERIDRQAEYVEALLASHQRMLDDIGGLKGKMLELEYRDRATAYFGPLLRKGRVIDTSELWDAIEASLTDREVDDAILADLIMRGAVRGRSEPAEVVLVIEVSFVVDRFDVERAHRRAALLRRAGLPAIGVAAGERMTEGAKEAADEGGVVLVEHHVPLLWEEALRGLAA